MTLTSNQSRLLGPMVHAVLPLSYQHATQLSRSSYSNVSIVWCLFSAVSIAVTDNGFKEQGALFLAETLSTCTRLKRFQISGMLRVSKSEVYSYHQTTLSRKPDLRRYQTR